MINFKGTIVQFGFGAVGKSFYEKIKKEVSFDENKYHILTRDKYEFEAYVNLGGVVSNFHLCDVNKYNYKKIFERYLKEGDILIDFADSVGTRDICDWCAERNVMYLNTGETDWPDNWYSIFNENVLKCKLREKYNEINDKNKHPIVLQHGNNPGLVSHFVKAGIEYIVSSQYHSDKRLKALVKEGKFNEVAHSIGVKMIQVNDIDLQQINSKYDDKTLFSTWCIDSFFFEMLSESTINIGTHENIDFEGECKFLDYEKGFLELKNIAVDTKCNTYYSDGEFEGFLVPHEETITIADSLKVEENGQVIYRPSVMFVYKPCLYAENYFKSAKVNDYPNVDMLKPQDCENIDGKSIVRGYIYPQKAEIVYKEKISDGYEYVGVLLIGEKFKPVWVGNRLKYSFIDKDKKYSYWQTPTITPVAMSALAATCWMIKNKDKGGIYFPDDIKEYKYILKTAEKYISKTIYKTFDKETIADKLKIDFNNIQVKDVIIKDKK